MRLPYELFGKSVDLAPAVQELKARHDDFETRSFVTTYRGVAVTLRRRALMVTSGVPVVSSSKEVAARSFWLTQKFEVR